MIKTTTTKANPVVHGVELEVTQSGMVVSVAGGVFKFGREDFDLPQTDYTAPVVDHDVSVHGWLVKERATGKPLLAVDENRGDGPFDWSRSPFRKMDLLFSFLLRANTETLDDTEITVRHLVPPPPSTTQRVELTQGEIEARTRAREARLADKAAEETSRRAAYEERRRRQALLDEKAKEARQGKE